VCWRADVEFVPTPSSARRNASSIQAGLRALKGPIPAALLTPGDLPAIRPDTIGALLRAWATAPEKIWAPEFGGRRGHPVLLPEACWPDLLALGESESLRTFLRRHETEIARLAVEDPGIHADLDTPADYQRAVEPSD
jgi:CTP:molybdopterin cytidylyltransferase MocA